MTTATCPCQTPGCNRVGRLVVLGGRMVCPACLLAAEMRLAQAIERGELRSERRVGMRRR